MSVAIGSVLDSWHDGKREHVKGVLTISGNYVVGGEVANLAHSAIKTTKPPVHFQANGTTGNSYEYQRSTGKIIVRAAGVELTAEAYPAPILADVVEFYGIFKNQ